jgi:tRNA-2-methylthio-N6-dimethylallyladenosine synthase
MVGFPGETEAEYQMTLAAVREIAFDAAFMFRYSVREGTWAADHLADDIPEPVKLERLTALIGLQKEVAYQVNQREIGRTRSVLIDGVSRRDAAILKGKTEGNKTILLRGGADLRGRIVPVTVTAADSWTLHGEPAA